MSQLFASGSQSIGASASTSVLPMNTQGTQCLFIMLTLLYSVSVDILDVGYLLPFLSLLDSISLCFI